MKPLRILLAIIIPTLILISLSFIPDNPGTAYPIQTPVPPTYLGPIWFGVYCTYPGAPAGYLEVRWEWDGGFPPGYTIDVNNPGNITVFYPPSYYQYRQLAIVENGVSHIWGGLWTPIQHAVADITGTVRLRKIDGSGGGSYTIQPTHWKQVCPRGGMFLPFLRK